MKQQNLKEQLELVLKKVLSDSISIPLEWLYHMSSATFLNISYCIYLLIHYYENDGV